MTQTGKTLIFVAAAAASVAVAAGSFYSNKPIDIQDFSDVGNLFYPKFDDPSIATALRVAAYNETTGKTEVFQVENKDGMWRIPSHHNYPADGKERLAKTAASMIGVTRLALEERSKLAHKRYDVLDPLDPELSGTEGRGDRITLLKGDEVLVDFIVGKKKENAQDLYYVRRADEERVYTADLGNLQVSTKFADWIQKDVLDVQAADVQELLINRYSVDEAQGKVVQEGQIQLTRPNDRDPWTMKDLQAETEKLKTGEIASMLNSLTDLQIVGVRRKPEALIAGLKSKDGTISIDPFIQRDLQQKGVFISPRGEFIYNEGKVNVGTKSGVLYELGFGEEFSGTDVDIEVGGEKSPAAAAEELAKEVEAPAKTDEPKPDTADQEADKPGQKKSRYLFVTVYFDKSLLGAAPTPPVKPEPPPEQQTEEPAAPPAASETPANTDSPSADAAEAKADEAKDPAAPAADPAEAKPADETPPAETSTEEKKAPSAAERKRAYEEALKDYDLQKEVYETRKKQYEAQLKEGEKRVGELNARFADWYYVISEEVFDRLKLKREDLVEPAQPAAEPAADGDNASPPAASADDPAMPAKPATTPASEDKPVSASEEASPPTEKVEEKPAEKPAPSSTQTQENPSSDPLTPAAEPAPEAAAPK